MNHQNSAGTMVTTGIPSIFLIFAVLCLVILSLMSMGTSRTDLAASRDSLEQVEGYYAACSQATHSVTEMEKSLRTLADSSTREEYCRLVPDQLLTIPDSSWDPDLAVFTFNVPYTDRMGLKVELAPRYPEDEEEECLSIVSWSAVQIGSWQPDTHQNLFIPGENSPLEEKRQ